MAGFIAIKDQSNADYAGKLATYSVAAAHASILAVGDVVALSGTADAFGVAGVDAAVAGSAATGVIASIDPTFAGEALSDTGLPASTAGDVKVHTSPDILYQAEVANGPLLVADVGLNVNIVATAATKSGGLTTSNMTVNATGKATTSTLNFRVVALLEDEDGTLGNRAIVRLNNSTSNTGTTGV